MQRRIEPVLADFHAYWVKLKGDRAMARRDEFRPSDIPRLLPHLTIVQPEDDRFRVRLIGTEVHRRIARPFRPNMMLDELETGRYLSFLVNVYRTVAASAKPVLSRTRYQATAGEVVISRLSIPFENESGHLFQIISAIDFSHTGSRQTDLQIIVGDDFEHSCEVWEA
jgi:hypothetical protein